MSAPRGITTEDAVRAARPAWRDAGERVVLSNGAFDVLHVGHVRALQGAAALGDRLVVAVNDDAAVRAARGPGRPHVPLAERMEVVAGLSCVDHVIPFADTTVDRLLESLRPDVHAKGRDYETASLPERATNERLGIEMAFVGDEKTRSATSLVARLRAGGQARERAAPSFRDALAAAGWLDLGRWATTEEGELVEGTARRWVRRLRIGDDLVYAKVTRPAEAKRSPVLEFGNHEALRAAGLRAPEPLLALEGDVDGVPTGVLVTRAVEGADLDRHLAGRGGRREDAAGIGRAARALHDAGFQFPDMQAWHLLVDRDLADGAAAITFLDLMRLKRRRRPPSRRQAARGLAALALSLRPVTTPRFRLGILRAFLGGSLRGARPWLRAIARRIEKIEHRGTFRNREAVS